MKRRFLPIRLIRVIRGCFSQGQKSPGPGCRAGDRETTQSKGQNIPMVAARTNRRASTAHNSLRRPGAAPVATNSRRDAGSLSKIRTCRTVLPRTVTGRDTTAKILFCPGVVASGSLSIRRFIIPFSTLPMLKFQKISKNRNTADPPSSGSGRTTARQVTRIPRMKRRLVPIRLIRSLPAVAGNPRLFSDLAFVQPNRNRKGG